MYEADDAYSIRSTWYCYWLDQFLTLALYTLILSIFFISLDLSTIYFAHFSGCWASFLCSCHSILECCIMFYYSSWVWDRLFYLWISAIKKMTKIWHFPILDYYKIRTRANFENPNGKSLDLHLIMWFALKQLFPGSTDFTETIYKLQNIFRLCSDNVICKSVIYK